MHKVEREWLDQQDKAYEAWAREHADTLAQEAYEAWASDRREDGEDDSQEAYEEYIESCLPDYA